MPHQASILLLHQCFLLLAAAIFGGFLARRCRLPAVVGELMAGVLLGPSLFGALAPEAYGRLFPLPGDAPAVAAGREAVLRFGMLLFLFAAGRELRLSRAARRAVVGAGLGGFLVPFGLGFATVLAAPPGLFGHATVHDPALPLFFGTALAISALPVIARILMELDLLRHPLGATALAASSLDDLAGWVIFSTLLPGGDGAPARGFAQTLGVLALAAAATTLLLGAVRPALHHRILPRASGAAALPLAVATALLFGALAEAAGLHAAFGAFAAGALFAPVEGADVGEKADPVSAVALGVFAPLYFVAAGMKADFVRAFDAPLVLVVLAAACVGKVAGVWAGARLGGMTARESLAVAFAMNARGAMEILLATLAREAGLIDDRLFVALVVTALVTSVMAGPILRRLTRPPRTEDVPAGRPPGADTTSGRPDPVS